MAIYDEIGYLEADYLLEPYFEGTAYFGLLFQVDRKVGELVTVDAQVDRRVDTPRTIDSQVERFLEGKVKQLDSQVNRISGTVNEIRLQTDRVIGGTVKTVAMEASRGGIPQGDCDGFGYFVRDYLRDPYLTSYVCAHLPMQVSRKPAQINDLMSQVERKIDALNTYKGQTERRIDAQKSVLFQVEARKSKTIMMQVRKVLYNTFNLRILYDFPSRGNGNNWTITNGGAALGDFGVQNLNTDIPEQVFRSTSATNVTMVCDTGIGNGVFVDTLAILNHNLTNSATIQVQGSQSSSFTNTFDIQLRSDGSDNIIWIAPTIPLQSYRYWRFSFSNNGNPDGYIQIGTIVFGSSIIFQGENVVDTIIKTPKHFADKVVTEGFTTVSNDRALKNSITLEFRHLDYNKENYALLKQVFNYCRTSLKALWIPTPETPTRFGVFGKLASLPSEQHLSMGANADYISFSIEVDESL